MGPVVISLFGWVFFLVSSLILFPIAVLIFLVTFLFDRERVVVHRFLCFWGSLYIWVMPLWKVSIEGREKIRPRKAYVLVSNHQSFLDILVLYGLFRHFKWVAKTELFMVPFVGWDMYLADYIRLDRGSSRSHLKMMRASERALRAGSSIMIFPEGTRTPTGEIQRFKDGAFILAQRTEVPVVPIVLDGTFHAIPKKGFVVKETQHIRLKVLDPLPPAAFAGLSTKELADKVKQLMAATLAEMRAAEAGRETPA